MCRWCAINLIYLRNVHLCHNKGVKKCVTNDPFWVLFTSGYTNDAVSKHGISETKQNFIQKPFTFEDLSKKVREIIDNVNL